MIIKCNKDLYVDTNHICRYEVVADIHSLGVIRVYMPTFSTTICKTPTPGIAEAILKDIMIALYKGNSYHEITGATLPLSAEVEHELQ